MNEVIEFFSGLLATHEWPPRWYCGYWSSFHGWLYIISDMMIWFAYSAIPLIIINFFYKKKARLKFPRVYFLFAAFILLCGSTHFLDAMMFWVPMYRVNAIVRFMTGVVSLTTVYYLFRILPEAFRQRTSVELENEIARREAAEAKLASINKELEAFAYIASHDLQEPMRKIMTFSSRLLEANEHQFNQESKGFANKILTSSARMQAMIQDILNLSTISDRAEMTKVNVEEVIASVIEDLEMKIQEKNAVINVGNIPAVTGNRAYLAQLFLNMISNAMKFNTRQPVVNITGERSGKNVFIHIEDNGIGMRQEDTEKIFGAFQRLHSKADFEGSGIGLAICQKIVDVHKGAIKVKSVLGEGTTFTIELKASEAVTTNDVSSHV